MNSKEIYTELIFIVTTILLSSNMEYTIQQSGTAIRASSIKRHFLNFMFEACKEIRENTDPILIKQVKNILRHRDVKDTIRHYTGRRNCGTKRTFSFAGFGPYASATEKIEQP